MRSTKRSVLASSRSAALSRSMRRVLGVVAAHDSKAAAAASTARRASSTPAAWDRVTTSPETGLARSNVRPLAADAVSLPMSRLVSNTDLTSWAGSVRVRGLPEEGPCGDASRGLDVAAVHRREDLVLAQRLPRELGADTAVVQDEDAVAERGQFVQVGGAEQHDSAGVRHRPDE